VFSAPRPAVVLVLADRHERLAACPASPFRNRITTAGGVQTLATTLPVLPRRRSSLKLRSPGVLEQLQQLPRHAGGQVHAAAVTVGMAELDQVVQQLLIQGRHATAAIAAVPTRVVGAVVGVLARLGLVALLQRSEAATAVALPRAGGSEPCAAVRAGADPASSNGALLSQVQDNLASLRALRRGVFPGLSRLICGTAVAAARNAFGTVTPCAAMRRPTRLPLIRLGPADL
jgi:hypothetical protein